jgi:hypothetical protein
MSKVNTDVISITREYLEMGGKKMTDKEWKCWCYEIVNNVGLNLYEEIIEQRKSEVK